MAIEASGRLTTPHDWHSDQYVADWIVHDTARDPERRPRLQEMLAAAPFARDAEFEVLDVGAGYGAVTEEVLEAFPRARITLQEAWAKLSSIASSTSPLTTLMPSPLT